MLNIYTSIKRESRKLTSYNYFDYLEYIEYLDDDDLIDCADYDGPIKPHDELLIQLLRQNSVSQTFYKRRLMIPLYTIPETDSI